MGRKQNEMITTLSRRTGTRTAALAVTVVWALCQGWCTAAENTVLTFDQPETAGISGFRAFWDRPVVLAEGGPVEMVRHHAGGGIGLLVGPTACWSPAKREDGALPGALVVTLVPDPKGERPGRLGPPADIPAFGRKLKGKKAGGQPTAVMPSAPQIAGWVATFGFRQPEGMPDWQWQRLKELKALGGGWDFPATPETYAKRIDGLLACRSTSRTSRSRRPGPCSSSPWSGR